MHSVTELDLAHLPLEDPSFAANPFPHFEAARERHPWLAQWQLGPIVTRYQAFRDLLKQEDKMRMPYDQMVEYMGATGTAWGRFQENHILARSGESHRRLRDILAPAFTPRQANLHRPLMREVISSLLDEWAPKGKFDFEEFASYFPVTVMFKLIGAPPEALPGIRSSLETLGLSVSMDRSLMVRLNEAVEVLDSFVDELVAEREKESRSGVDNPDLLDVLLQAKAAGGLSQRELADILVFLFPAGFDTSKNILTLIMYQMIDQPEVYERCAVDWDYCRQVVDETMRFHSVTTTNRLLTEDIVYRDVLLPAGTSLWFPWSIIGRDPEAAEAADEFRPERDQKNPHLGFALGAHLCLGQFIARAQLQEGLHLIAQRIKNPRSPGPSAWRPFPGVWGIRGLPIEFDPAEAPHQETALKADA